MTSGTKEPCTHPLGIFWQSVAFESLGHSDTPVHGDRLIARPITAERRGSLVCLAAPYDWPAS